MTNFRFSHFLKLDWISIIAILFLLATGLLAIFSLSLEVDKETITNFQKQLIFLLIGFFVFLIVSFIDYRSWKSFGGILYLIGTLLLLAVLIWGETIKGTSGWFRLGQFSVQPAEIMKLFLIISLAKYFSQNRASFVSFKNLVVSFIYTAIPMSLSVLQPDMGSAIIFFVIWLGMIFFAGLSKKQVLGIALVLVLAFFAGWNFVLKDYQKNRIETFLNPQADPLGSGYNVIQSMVAVGSGGIEGKGLGYGSQSQLNFLPEKHTDFIFAAIAEESGFIGAALVIGMIWLLLFRMKKAMDGARDIFGNLLVGGVLVTIFFQTVINIGMNLGIMPVAGLSLPFISYGGSFLIIVLVMMGIVQNIWQYKMERETLLIDYE